MLNEKKMLRSFINHFTVVISGARGWWKLRGKLIRAELRSIREGKTST